MAHVPPRRSRTSDRRTLARGARLADQPIQRLRCIAGAELDRLHATLRRVEARHDPSTHAWMDEMRKSIADGSVWEEINAQRDLQVILDDYRKQLT